MQQTEGLRQPGSGGQDVVGFRSRRRRAGRREAESKSVVASVGPGKTRVLVVGQEREAVVSYGVKGWRWGKGVLILGRLDREDEWMAGQVELLRVW